MGTGDIDALELLVGVGMLRRQQLEIAAVKSAFDELRSKSAGNKPNPDLRPCKIEASPVCFKLCRQQKHHAGAAEGERRRHGEGERPSAKTDERKGPQ